MIQYESYDRCSTMPPVTLTAEYTSVRSIRSTRPPGSPPWQGHFDAAVQVVDAASAGVSPVITPATVTVNANASAQRNGSRIIEGG